MALKAVIYEVPQAAEVQKQLKEVEKTLFIKGFKIVRQNSGGYRSNERPKGVGVVIAVKDYLGFSDESPYFPKTSLILNDYKTDKVRVIYDSIDEIKKAVKKLAGEETEEAEEKTEEKPAIKSGRGRPKKEPEAEPSPEPEPEIEDEPQVS